MLDKRVKIFDCTLREVGYQTGWYFDPEFCKSFYQFAANNGIDYIELGFMYAIPHDPGRGLFCYCTDTQAEIREIFEGVKDKVKISSMVDLQSPFTPIRPAKDGVVDAVRIMTRSLNTNEDELKRMVDTLRVNGYNEIYVNFTRAGLNTIETNERFADIAKEIGLPTIYFADTESTMTEKYVRDAIDICHSRGLKCGIHLHNKNGAAEDLCKFGYDNGVDYTDITLLGLGGKWCDGNLSTEFLLRYLGVQPGYGLTLLKNDLIHQLIKYHVHSATTKSSQG
jgi:4-hydroxy 2-oxovalerate aldolase